MSILGLSENIKSSYRCIRLFWKYNSDVRNIKHWLFSKTFFIFLNTFLHHKGLKWTRTKGKLIKKNGGRKKSNKLILLNIENMFLFKKYIYIVLSAWNEIHSLSHISQQRQWIVGEITVSLIWKLAATIIQRSCTKSCSSVPRSTYSFFLLSYALFLAKILPFSHTKLFLWSPDKEKPVHFSGLVSLVV